MDLLHFDHKIAGTTTLWIIRFDPKRQEERHFDLLLPSPIDKDGWMVVSDVSPTTLVNFLNQFQQMCESVKSQCQQRIVDIKSSSPTSSKNISQELENFTHLIRYFNEIMKHLKKPPLEDDP